MHIKCPCVSSLYFNVKNHKELLLSKITALQDIIDAILEESDMDVEELLEIVE